MKCSKISALEIFKTQQIRPKASILSSSAYGGHVLQRWTCPKPYPPCLWPGGKEREP